MAGFRSLRERQAGPPDPDEVLPLNVLPYMRQPLLDWLVASTNDYSDRDYWQLLCKMLKIDYTGSRPYTAVVQAVNDDNDLLLDLVDARLRLGSVPNPKVLTSTLAFAGSGWRIDDEGDRLEQVVDTTVAAAAKSAIAAAGASASTHLARAWSTTFGKDRNPTLAHAEMIRAVESAAAPVVTPNDSKATLGTMIGQLDAQGHLYTTAGASATNDGVPGVVAMMKILWQQQTDRHGANPTVPATQDRVEFLLPIAAALVHAFSNGHLRRK